MTYSSYYYTAIDIQLLLALALALPYQCDLAQPHITVPPVSVTVPPFTTATFTCEGNGTTLKWLVDLKELTSDIQKERGMSFTDPGNGSSVLTSVLTIDGLPVNDGIEISCQIVSYLPFEQALSGSSTLTIRGVSAVEDIQYNFTSDNSLLITWSPPVYYSNDVPAGSPFHYQVLVTDEDGDIMLLDTITPNTNITIPNVTECDTFNISVTAMLDRYNANSNIGYEGLGYNATITTSEDNFLTPNVSIELSCPPSQSYAFLTITNGSEVIDQYILTGTDEATNDIRTLLTSNEYNYTVRVFNLRNKLEYENSTTITTYQVIGLYISNTYTNGSVSVQCVFVPGSTADGCHVIFTDTINGRNEYFNITGSDNTIVSLSTSGNYTLTVYDSINGSLYGPAVQYYTLVEIIKVMPSTTSSIIISESTATTQSTVTNNVSPTITVTVGTETTSSTNGTINETNDYIVPVVAGLCSTVLMILIILAVCVVLTVYKRKRMKEVFIRSEKPQADPNQYQEVNLTMNEVPINTSPVQLTNNRPIDDE